jgi:hypothetical protein
MLVVNGIRDVAERAIKAFVYAFLAIVGPADWLGLGFAGSTDLLEKAGLAGCIAGVGVIVNAALAWSSTKRAPVA